MGQQKRRGVGGANEREEGAGGVVDGGVGVDVLYWDGGGGVDIKRSHHAAY